jgi:hypothetical protein
LPNEVTSVSVFASLPEGRDSGRFVSVRCAAFQRKTSGIVGMAQPTLNLSQALGRAISAYNASKLGDVSWPSRA